jgi:hypothetical protein
MYEKAAVPTVCTRFKQWRGIDIGWNIPLFSGTDEFEKLARQYPQEGTSDT